MGCASSNTSSSNDLDHQKKTAEEQGPNNTEEQNLRNSEEQVNISIPSLNMSSWDKIQSQMATNADVNGQYAAGNKLNNSDEETSQEEEEDDKFGEETNSKPV